MSKELEMPANWLGHVDTQPVPGRSVVVDIDGVISDATARQYFLEGEKKDWSGFFEASGSDGVINEMRRLLDLLASDLTVILLTGRPLHVQPITVEWLTAHEIRWDILIMRNAGSYSGSLNFKRQTVRQLKVMGFVLDLAFEDDAQNHAMFQGEDIPCVYIHSGYYINRDARLP